MKMINEKYTCSKQPNIKILVSQTVLVNATVVKPETVLFKIFYKKFNLSNQFYGLELIT